MNKQDIQTIFADASAKYAVANAAKQVMADLLLTALQNAMPAGTVINLERSRENPRPDYLFSVSTLSGNDRGTKKFRIERITSIDINVIHPYSSRWECDATPLSMKTGESMSGQAGNGRRNRDTVRLISTVGFGDSPLDEKDGLTAIDRFMEFISTNTQ